MVRQEEGYSGPRGRPAAMAEAEGDSPLTCTSDNNNACQIVFCNANDIAYDGSCFCDSGGSDSILVQGVVYHDVDADAGTSDVRAGYLCQCNQANVIVSSVWCVGNQIAGILSLYVLPLRFFYATPATTAIPLLSHCWCMP
jgi:hypothetical protein